MAQLRDGRYIVAGRIVQDSFALNQNWLAFFDGDFNKLDENISGDYDANDLWSFHQHSDGDLIFWAAFRTVIQGICRWFWMGKRLILCTDSLGRRNGYHEFYDTS